MLSMSPCEGESLFGDDEYSSKLWRVLSFTFFTIDFLEPNGFGWSKEGERFLVVCFVEWFSDCWNGDVVWGDSLGEFRRLFAVVCIGDDSSMISIWNGNMSVTN